jgi:D-alanyl-D-alanine carboxypeptidase/D-alanyl-D-alanine-endopeptidase (penicillin-binding protein 4)
VRWRNVIPLVVATAVTGAAVFTAVERQHDGQPSAAPSPRPSPTQMSVRPAVLAALDPAAVLPPAADVRAAIAAAVAKVPNGEHLTGTVIDVSSGTTLWSHDAAMAMAPASTTKLLTAAAALQSLGLDYRFHTTTKQLGNTVYLVGGGDPTLVRSVSSPVVPGYPQPASLSELAASTASQLTPGVPIELRVDTTAWSGPALAHGWSADYVSEGDVTPPSALELDGGRRHPADFDSPRTMDPSGQAASAFAAMLRADGVAVDGAIKQEAAPGAAAPLASVSSPPLSELVQRMLTASDNDLAEALGRAVAKQEGMPADFTGAAAAVLRQVAELGVPTSSLTLHDTSGLSHDDLIDPATLVAVLRTAAAGQHPVLAPIVEGLPVAGFTGTLADRYRAHGAKDGGGVVRAKTGTLTDVDGLAGLVVDRAGRLLAFAFLTSGSGTEDSVEQGLDRITSSLAALS